MKNGLLLQKKCKKNENNVRKICEYQKKVVILQR